MTEVILPPTITLPKLIEQGHRIMLDIEDHPAPGLEDTLWGTAAGLHRAILGMRDFAFGTGALRQLPDETQWRDVVAPHLKALQVHLDHGVKLGQITQDECNETLAGMGSHETVGEAVKVLHRIRTFPLDRAAERTTNWAKEVEIELGKLGRTGLATAPDDPNTIHDLLAVVHSHLGVLGQELASFERLL